jgi:methane monooxygenase component A beta chain/propane monooxygenase small subunit
MTTTPTVPRSGQAQDTERLSGNREFVFFTPRGRRPTDYESFTLGQHVAPENFLFVGWPVRFDDGTPPFRTESTALRSSDWDVFRDPTQTWQREYVAAQDVQERALATTSRALVHSGVLGGMNPAWRDRVLPTQLATYPFVNYGLFRALSYAVREALTSAVTYALAFEAQDNLRSLQDIVHATFDLAEAIPGWSDGGARAAWMGAPEWQGAREAVEGILASEDWGEILVAINLVFEPLFGRLVKRDFLLANAARNGDPLTAALMLTGGIDTERQLAWSQELVRVLLADPEHASGNRAAISGWIERWTPRVLAAVDGYAPVFSTPGITTGEPFAAAAGRAREHQRALCAALSL